MGVSYMHQYLILLCNNMLWHSMISKDDIFHITKPNFKKILKIYLIFFLIKLKMGGLNVLQNLSKLLSKHT